MPLPPYIRRGRDRRRTRALSDRLRGATGSVAAPTAGLHFTPELLDRTGGAASARPGDAARRPRHVRRRSRPTTRQHAIHAEWCEVIASETWRRSGQGPRRPGRSPSAPRRRERSKRRRPAALQPFRGETNSSSTRRSIPCASMALITNFHLPRTTLLLLVRVRRERIACRRPTKKRFGDYRFYSYGDAMLVL